MEGSYSWKIFSALIHHTVTKGAWSKEMINVGSTKSDTVAFELFVDSK